MTHLIEVERVLKGAHGQALTASEVKDDELMVTIAPSAVADVARFLSSDKTCLFDYLMCLSGIDYPEHVTVVYHLFATGTKSKMTVKTDVLKPEPSLASVTPIWAGADWHEREAAEMFGLVFEGHPDPRKLLLDDENDATPLRKDFKLDYASEK